MFFYCHTSSRSKLINGFSRGGSGSGVDERDELDDEESFRFPLSNCGSSEVKVLSKLNRSYGIDLKILDFKKINFYF
jgi:hypothetical protein